MAEASRIPATINIDQKMQEDVVGVIDEHDYMLLGKSTVPHSELYMFAMALGWDKKLNPEMEKPASGGFIRSESFPPKLSALIDAVHYAVVGFESPDSLRDHRASFKLAEKYANGGFHLLAGDLSGKVDTETVANDLIAEMNEKWEEWFGDRG